MRLSKKVLAAAALVTLFCGASYAVLPAYVGPMGNAEEPALRPYKWLWSGLKALAYQPVVALKNGNMKTPGLGSAEVFQGVRRGAVELDESILHGMMGARPPASDRYKSLGKANQTIEDDPLLRNVADFIACYYVYTASMGGGLGGLSGLPLSPFRAEMQFGFASNAIRAAHTSGEAFKVATVLWLSQKHVEQWPYNSPEKQEQMKKKAAEWKATKKKPAPKSDFEPPIEKARQRYLADRPAINKKAPFSGNILRMAR